MPPRIADVAASPQPPAAGPSRPGSRAWLWTCVIGLAVLGLPAVCAVGVTGYFRLSSPTKALRETVMESVPGQWDKRFAVHLGWLTTGLVRSGSRLFKMSPEPRAALDALHGVEVGIYRLREEPAAVNCQALFLTADKAMKARGWERVVGVLKDRKLVVVYVPNAGVSTSHMDCCLMVLSERDLVVASARGNLEPLLELAEVKGFGKTRL